MISIRNRDDVVDIWKDMNKGTKVVLWCNGLKLKRKKRAMSDDDKDENNIECDSRRKGRERQRKERTRLVTYSRI